MPLLLRGRQLIYSIIHDIIDLRQMEQALVKATEDAEAENRELQHAIDHANQMHILMAEDGLIDQTMGVGVCREIGLSHGLGQQWPGSVESNGVRELRSGVDGCADAENGWL